LAVHPLNAREARSLRARDERLAPGSIVEVRPSSARVSPRLGRALARTGARTRLAGELREIATDLLGRCQPDELPTDSAAWLVATVDAAVANVCDSALEALVAALDSRLAAAPAAVVRRLDAAEARHDAGFR
jgi:hypothetical protein